MKWTLFNPTWNCYHSYDFYPFHNLISVKRTVTFSFSLSDFMSTPYKIITTSLKFLYVSNQTNIESTLMK